MDKTNKGSASLKAAVLNDCKNGCFNENGCDQEGKTKCFHRYCNKYKWIMERADHYAEKTGKTREEILTIWETHRNHWYMNYYQDGRFPLLGKSSIMDFDDWVAELEKRFGDKSKWAFVCPNCGNIQTPQDFIDAGVDPKGKFYFSCIGRDVEDKGCDWTLGGLFQIHKQAVFKDGIITPVFEMAPAN